MLAVIGPLTPARVYLNKKIQMSELQIQTHTINLDCDLVYEVVGIFNIDIYVGM